MNQLEKSLKQDRLLSHLTQDVQKIFCDLNFSPGGGTADATDFPPRRTSLWLENPCKSDVILGALI
jgi:hypothetical protein